jgi:hypothetical protein
MSEDPDSGDNDNDPATVETVSFPFDRMTVQRFRETFPQARWSDSLGAWTVPGKTAQRRVALWRAKEAARTDLFATEKGRDAYHWEPILSRYLEVSDWGFRIRTPYSRTVVEELRQIPYSRWNGEQRVWEVPFASYDELQARWQAIEEAAMRAEPEERRKRAEARKGSDEEAQSRRRTAERRRRRLPVPSDDLPPLERPVGTTAHGVVVVCETSGELVEPDELAALYPQASHDHVWCTWRLPTLEELVHTWPSKHPVDAVAKTRGWWQPTMEELREARRAAKTRERGRDLAASENRTQPE